MKEWKNTQGAGFSPNHSKQMCNLNIHIYTYIHIRTHLHIVPEFLENWIKVSRLRKSELHSLLVFSYLVYFKLYLMYAFLLIQLSYLDNLHLKCRGTYCNFSKYKVHELFYSHQKITSNCKICPNSNFTIIMIVLLWDSNSSYSAVTIT